MPSNTFTPTFSFDVKMNIEFDINQWALDVEDIMREGVKYAFNELHGAFRDIIIMPLIYGGPGWHAITNTMAWKWINSQQGYGELGFAKTTEPRKLLKAYESAWNVSLDLNQNGGAIKFNFGDVEMLRSATRHPKAGRGHMKSDRSWLDWIYEGVHFATEPAKFRRTGSKKGIVSSNIAGPFAGRMIKYRKEGSLWSVKPLYRLDMDKFLDKNRDKLQSTIENFLVLGFKDYIES